MLPMIILILIAAIAAVVAAVGIKVSPIITLAIGLISALVLLAVFISSIFGITGLLDFLLAQNWMIAIAGGWLIGDIVGLFI